MLHTLSDILALLDCARAAGLLCYERCPEEYHEAGFGCRAAGKVSFVSSDTQIHYHPSTL